MKKHTIWRVENELGNGPYTGQGNCADQLIRGPYRNLHIDTEKRPDAYFDPLLRDAFNMKCHDDRTKVRGWAFGFKTIRDYRAWFPTRDLQGFLNERGFMLVQFEASPKSIIHGTKQSVFRREEAKAIAKRACNSAGIKQIL